MIDKSETIAAGIAVLCAAYLLTGFLGHLAEALTK